jgi:hypothetical protein
MAFPKYEPKFHADMWKDSGPFRKAPEIGHLSLPICGHNQGWPETKAEILYG